MAKNSPHGVFFALLNRMPGASKESLVWAYSNGHTDSLSAFLKDDPRGYDLMLRELRKRIELEAAQRTKKLRSGILKRLQQHGIDTTDWHEVNRFLEHPRIAGKRLYSMNDEELSKLTGKLEAILAKEREKHKETTRLSQLN